MSPTPVSDIIASLEASGETHSINYGGQAMTWHRFGKGQPLVLLHGGHGSWLHWIKNIPALSATRSVWVPDMPGYGTSSALSLSAGLDELLVAMLGMLDDIFGVDGKIDLVGFSFGGLIAANIAARRTSVRSLTLLGPAGHGGRRRLTTALINWRKSRDTTERDVNMRHNLAVHMLSGPKEVDDLALAVHSWSCLNTRFRSSGISRRPPLKLKEILASRDLPILLLWGGNDVTADPQVLLPELTEGYAQRRGQILAGSGHWVQYERHEEINELVGDWLEQQK